MTQRPPRWQNWSPTRQARWQRANQPGGNNSPGAGNRPPRTPPGAGTPAWSPDWQPGQGGEGDGDTYNPGNGGTPNFLANTPAYEAARRGLTDQLNFTLSDIASTKMLMPAQVEQFMARSQNDEQWDHSRLDEQLEERGVFQSGINPYLRMRDVYTPYGRARQDFQSGVTDALRQLTTMEGQAHLTYNQGISEALLQRAADVAQSMPYSNQFSAGPDYYGAFFGGTPQTMNRPVRRPTGSA